MAKHGDRRHRRHRLDYSTPSELSGPWAEFQAPGRYGSAPYGSRSSGAVAAGPGSNWKARTRPARSAGPSSQATAEAKATEQAGTLERPRPGTGQPRGLGHEVNNDEDLEVSENLLLRHRHHVLRPTGRRPVEAFNRGQWMSIPREQGYTLLQAVLQVRRLDTKEIVELDAVGAYQGRQFHLIRPGVIVKLYHHPKCRRPWCYKLTGD